MGVFHEFVGQGGDVNQTILMHADIHEGAEVGHVGHRTFQNHGGLQVLEGFHPFLEDGSLEFRTRIATGFFQFAEDIGDRGQAERVVGKVGGVDLLQEGHVTDQLLERPAMFLGDLFHQRVGFRVDRGTVQRIGGVHDAQEAGGLFEGLVAQARYQLQVGAAGKGAVAFPVGNDVAGDGAVEAGNASQQWGAGGIHVYPHGVHTVFHHRIQGAGQLQLAHVVLVLAHADGFRIDLHQLGQRVLQAAGNGHGATEGHVQIREFPGGGFRSGVHRGAGFGHHDLLDVALAGLDHFAGQLVGFPAGGAVTNGDQFHLVLQAQGGQCGQ